MNWLVDNAIGNMNGPHFLVFYGSAIVMTLVVCAWWVRSGDRSADRPLMELPKSVDPYQAAYLRGGKNEVIRLAIFELVERGYVEIRQTKQGRRLARRLARKEDHPSPDELRPEARTAFEWFCIVRQPEEVFRDRELSSRMEKRCQEITAWAEQEELLAPAELRRAGWTGFLTGALLIFGLGFYKLVVALGKGRYNVGFLIVMGIVGLVILFFVARPSRLSRRGKRYLAQLQETLQKYQRPWEGTYPTSYGTDPAMLLSVGLFGMATLATTPYSSFHQMFRRGASSGGCSGSYVGGCSGGCGGATTNGGGGCSGGGGGCSGGGGGCGGCGGG